MVPLDPQSLAFPTKGLHEAVGYDMQPPDTSPDELNVRSFDTALDRLRGGSRPGLEKWQTYPQQLNGNNPIQLLTQVVRSIAQETDTVYMMGHTSPPSVSDSESHKILSLFDSLVQPIDYTAGNELMATQHRPYVNSIVRDSTGITYAWVTVPNVGFTSFLIQILTDQTIGFSLQSSCASGISDGTLTLSDDDSTLYVGRTKTATPDDFDSGSTGHNLFSLAVSPGGVVFNWGVRTHQSYNVNRIKILDSATGPSIRLAVAQWSPSVNTDDHVLLVNGDDGSRLDSWNFNSVTSGFQLDIHANNHQLVVAGIRANANWTAHSSTANIFLFDIQGVTLDSLVLNKAFHIGAGISDDPSGVGIPAVFLSNDSTSIVYLGQRILNINATRFNVSDSSTVWTQNLGKDSASLSLWSMTVVDAGLFIGGVRTNNWDNAGGVYASVFLLDFTDGSITWTQDPALDDANDPSGSGGRVFSVGVGGSGTLPSTRQTALLSVIDGTINKIDEQGYLTSPSGGTGILNPVLHTVSATAAYNHAFFVDGVHEYKYDLNTDMVSAWTATTAGTIQPDMRLIVTWRGRIVGSGVVADPHNYFMAASGDPFDWDYSPTTPNALQAVAGNNSDAGLVGDIITGLLPLSDDILIFGGDHTLYKMTGDPAAGGVVDLMSDQTGMAYGKAWAKDPDGIAYFVGTDGIYRINDDGTLENMTQNRWPKRFATIDQSKYRAYMVWDYGHHCLLVQFMSLIGSSNIAFCWEKRADAWHVEEYPSTIGPTALLAYDGPKTNDKVTMFGSKDGRIRVVKDGANDDGIDIISRVRFGPYIAPTRTSEVVLTSVQPIMGQNSGPVKMVVYSGQSAEDCVRSQTARVRRTLIHASRNHSMRQKVRGYAVQLGLESTDIWNMEGLAVGFEAGGMPRREVKPS